MIQVKTRIGHIDLRKRRTKIFDTKWIKKNAYKIVDNTAWFILREERDLPRLLVIDVNNIKNRVLLNGYLIETYSCEVDSGIDHIRKVIKENECYVRQLVGWEENGYVTGDFING